MDEHNHLMTPAYMHLRIDGHEIKIAKGDLAFSATNDSVYKLTTAAHHGHRDFLLIKGSIIKHAGELVVTIVKTPDGANQGSIDRVHEELKKSQNKADPKDYVKTYLFMVCASDHRSLMEICFKGYVKNIQKIAPKKEGFVTHMVTIAEFDGDSFRVE